MTENYSNGPVIIGGVGGSGTRVVAEILANLGFFIGNDLNAASDYHLYTLIFKRKKWFSKNCNKPEALTRGLKLIEKAMTAQLPLSIGDFFYLSHAALAMSYQGHNHLGKGKGSWPFKRLSKAFSQHACLSAKHIGWGWKEPNSHLLIDLFPGCFQNFRYIHTIRHGLDMAFSKNQQQLFNWHALFDVPIPQKNTEIPSASFKLSTKV